MYEVLNILLYLGCDTLPIILNHPNDQSVTFEEEFSAPGRRGQFYIGESSYQLDCVATTRSAGVFLRMRHDSNNNATTGVNACTCTSCSRNEQIKALERFCVGLSEEKVQSLLWEIMTSDFASDWFPDDVEGRRDRVNFFTSLKSLVDDCAELNLFGHE